MPAASRAGGGAAAPPATREIVRYTLLEPTVHWTVALTFLYLAFTGLGLFTPKLAWLLTVLGGGQTARALHPIAGCVFIAAVGVLLLMWLKDLLITPADRAWLRRARDYLAGRDERVPPSGRFNGGQKLLFWCQVGLGLALLGFEACDACGRYLKAIDLTSCPEAEPIADELGSVVLDAVALERGYEKIEPNLAGV